MARRVSAIPTRPAPDQHRARLPAPNRRSCGHGSEAAAAARPPTITVVTAATALAAAAAALAVLSRLSSMPSVYRARAVGARHIHARCRIAHSVARRNATAVRSQRQVSAALFLPACLLLVLTLHPVGLLALLAGLEQTAAELRRQHWRRELRRRRRRRPGHTPAALPSPRARRPAQSASALRSYLPRRSGLPPPPPPPRHCPNAGERMPLPPPRARPGPLLGAAQAVLTRQSTGCSLQSAGEAWSPCTGGRARPLGGYLWGYLWRDKAQRQCVGQRRGPGSAAG